jgi:hypothetical protein
MGASIDRRSLIRKGGICSFALVAAAVSGRGDSFAQSPQVVPSEIAVAETPLMRFGLLLETSEENRPPVDETGRPVYVGSYAGWGWLDYASAAITHTWDDEAGDWRVS